MNERGAAGGGNTGWGKEINMSQPCVVAVVVACLCVAVVHGAEQGEVSVVERIPTATRNAHYPSTREPLLAVPLVKLPVGAVRPRGWLRKQLELQADGFHGHLTEISRFLKKEGNSWLSRDGQGQHGWEEVPYWLKGFGDTAYLLDRKDQIAEAKTWIEGAIASQREDGLFGPRGQGAKATVESTKGKYDLWPNMVMLNCLQSYYEYSGDPRVIELMTKYFKWQLAVPEEEFLPPYWQQQRAADNLASVYWLHARIGEPWLLELAAKVHRRTANWTDGVPDWHNVNMSQAFGGPTTFWIQSKDRKHLDASERNYQTIRNTYGQVPGGMFGGDENCRTGFDDPRQAIETCGIVEMMLSQERLLTLTGNLVWADRCEDVAFNSLPAALTADFKGLRYLTSPNLISSDRKNKSPGLQNGGPMLEMNPHGHRCCQHNFGHGWPYFVQHLVMGTADNGLAAVFYGNSVTTAKVGDEGVGVTLEQATEYPFDDAVTFTVKAPRAVRFPLYLRVPGWCDRATVLVDGQRQAVESKPGQFVRVEREWKDRDVVAIVLPMEVKVRRWAKQHNSVSVARGPLTYALKVGERVVRSGGTDKWPATEILPTSPWNYGLLEIGGKFDLSAMTVPPTNKELPFTHEGTSTVILAKARKIPQWKADRLGLVGLLQDSPAKSQEPTETVTLIPMGAARLRISQFPVVSETADAKVWQESPESQPMPVTASHCWEHDSPMAVADGRRPKDSNDHTIPRFTWWPNEGSAEWIQRELGARREVKAVSVYWFDDGPRNGGCRVPKGWRVTYRHNGEWRAVEDASPAGVARDQANVVTFKPVTTDALRLEVQLQDGFSAGILEWTVE